MKLSQKKVLLIFASLMGITLLAFQNCSNSLYLMTRGNSVKANHINDMLKDSESEIQTTKNELKTNWVDPNSTDVPRDIAAEDLDEMVEMDTSQIREAGGVRVKLKMKKSKKKQAH